MRPPWVRQSVTDAYFTLHPEARSYRASVVFEEFSKKGFTSGRGMSKTPPAAGLKDYSPLGLVPEASNEAYDAVSAIVKHENDAQRDFGRKSSVRQSVRQRGVPA